MTREMTCMKAGSAEFQRAFGEALDPWVAWRIDALDIRCRKMNQAERDGWIRRMVQALVEESPSRAGKSRQGDWETGWGQNLAAFREDPTFESILPKYFGKYPVLRFCGDLVVPDGPGCEYAMLSALQYWLFHRWLADAPSVYEFGCGTGHNLFRVREVNPTARLYGCDWAASSNELIAAMAENGLLGDLAPMRFDLFRPDRSRKLDSGAAVYTMAALEQVGTEFGPFLDFLIESRPSVCLHIEPVAELLNQERLMDYLSVRYFEKRGYLRGFLDELRRREAAGQLEILKAARTNVGSLFIEGYSAVVWRPL